MTNFQGKSTIFSGYKNKLIFHIVFWILFMWSLIFMFTFEKKLINSIFPDKLNID